MKVAFFGSPRFAVQTLELLAASPHQVVCVVTQPDKPAGRGLKLTPPAIKLVARKHGFPVLQPEKVRTAEFAAELAGYAPDVAVVVAYGKILPRTIIDLPRHGCLNIHASLLPRYRGAAPIQWAVVRGERITGVSIMQIDEGLDSGPVIAVREVEILEDDDANSLHDMLSVVGADLMMQVLADLEEKGSLEMTPQDHSKATLAPLIRREDARLDWKADSESVICAIRGFLPWPCAYTTLAGTTLKILAAEGVSTDWVIPGWDTPSIPAGTVIDVIKNRGFVVRTGGSNGMVLVTRVKPEGRQEMDAASFVNGGGLKVGARLG